LQRTSKGVIPTEQGRVLYERALKANKELQTAVTEIQQLSGLKVGELHIGAVPLAVMLLIPETLRTFCKEFPEVKLRISEELYVAQLQKLRANEVDLTIGGIPDDLSSGEFSVENLLTTRMVVTVRHGSPWSRARKLSELQSARWVYTGSNSTSGYAQLFFERHGLTAPPVGAIVNSTLALLSLVASGDYVALMPYQIAIQPLAAQHITIVDIEEKGLPLKVGAILNSNNAVTTLMRHFLRHLHRAAHQVGGTEAVQTDNSLISSPAN
jgi:DNA-binding transcriptional LysR family regulator